MVNAREWVERFLDAAEAEADALGELDRLAGDGDFGASVRTAVRSTRRGLGDAPPFAALSTAYLGTGGTSGPLYGMFFRALAKAAGDASELDLATLADGVGAGVASVRRLGGAQVGERTMVDALQPAADALAAGEGLDAAARAARAGADATADLVARRGRATYVGDAAAGVVDPGAALVALFFEAAAG
ncbi:DAK2 domain-containing protein [Solirubrobacter soli]|uniref:DAK2 domain-containing protein n=1 Tax=Solirubrobacter soli TaxID=363832 RepID=UPI00069CDBFE|nr:DAK2 domain-containing protein [Solirubrobacter soli]